MLIDNGNNKDDFISTKLKIKTCFSIWIPASKAL